MLIRKLIAFELKPMSEIVAIMDKFLNVGHNTQSKAIKTAADGAG